MKKIVVLMALLLLCAPWDGMLADGVTPLQISLCSPAQVFPRDWDVAGLRLNVFYSHNRGVYGLDLGLIANRADASSGGLQLGMFNKVSELHENFGVADYYRFHQGHARYTGIQLGLFGNVTDEMVGLQYGFVNDAGLMKGLQCGVANLCYDGSGAQLGLGGNVFGNFIGAQIELAVNITFGDFEGAQIGGLLMNYCIGDMQGVQIGGLLANGCDKSMTGIQVGGLMNVCVKDMHGVQVGLINYARQLYGIQIGLVNIISEGPVPVLPVVNAHF